MPRLQRFAKSLALGLLLLASTSALATDLVAQKELLTAGPIEVGDTVEFKLTIRNDKVPSAIETAGKLFERFPSGLTWTDIGGDIEVTGCLSVDVGGGFSGFDCDFFIFPQEVLMVWVSFEATEAGDFINSFQVTNESGELNGSDNEAQALVTVIDPAADLAISKTAAPDPVLVGDPVTFTLTVDNGGPSASPNTRVEDHVPAEFDIVSVTPSQGACDAVGNDNIVRCNLGNLPAAATATVVIVARPVTHGMYTNTASTTGDKFDPNMANNTNGVSVTVEENKADVQITKTADKATAKPGEDIVYTLVVRNNGPQLAEGIEVVDDLPTTSGIHGVDAPGVEFVSASGTGVGCSRSGSRVTCAVGLLAKGEQVTITITVYVTASRRLINGATVTSTSPPDPNQTNNTANAETDARRGGSTGSNPESGDALDPVNAFSGELFFDEVPDFELGGPFPLDFHRSYASFLDRTGAPDSSLGPNWFHPFSATLERTDTFAAVHMPNSQLVTFRRIDDSWSLVLPRDQHYQLVDTNSDTYRFGIPETQAIYEFDASGRLIAIQRGQLMQTLTYAADRLATVSDGFGRILSFTYDNEGLLTGISDGIRNVALAYTAGLLTSATDVMGATTTYTYDSNHAITGLQTARTEADGVTPYTQTYDDSGRVIQQTDALGNTSTLAYDEENLTTIATTAGGRQQHFIHDQDGKLQEQTTPTGTASITYDGNGRRTESGEGPLQIERMFDPVSGRVARAALATGPGLDVTYTPVDVQGIVFHAPASLTYPDGTSQTFTYDSDGDLITLVDQAGSTFAYTYNDRHQLVGITNPTGTSRTFGYDGAGNLTSFVDATGNTTTYTYDASSNRTRIDWPDGTDSTFTYDAAGRRTSETDGAGNATTYTYDTAGNLTAITSPGGGTTQFSYDGLRRRTGLTGPEGTQQTLTYTADGHLASFTDESGGTATYEYDGAGRLQSQVTPDGEVISVSYNENDQPTSVSTGTGSFALAYDVTGSIQQITTPGGRTTTFTLDANGRRTGVTDPGGHDHSFGISPQGSVNDLQLAGGLNANLALDDEGRIVAVTDPAGNIWSRSYDDNGRLATLTDPLSQTTTIEYDSRGRPISVNGPGTTVDHTYDAAGNRVSSQYDALTFNYTYDADSRLIATDGVSAAYNAAGSVIDSNGINGTRDDRQRLTSLTVPGGQPVTYTYDGQGRLTTVQDGSGGEATFAYTDARQLERVERSNGVTTTYDYDADGLLLSVSHSKDATVLQQQTLTRDARGNVTSAERITPVEQSVPAASANVSVDAAYQIDAYTYDAEGRRLSDDTRTYNWDAAGRLASVEEGDDTISYTYDALSRRLSRTQGATSDSYIWSDLHDRPALVLHSRDNTPMFQYVYAPDGRLLYRIDLLTDRRHWYHFDEMGHTTALSDVDGSLITAYAFTPYGRSMGTIGANEDNLFTYAAETGALAEPGLDLYLMGARTYDAQSGRFITRDPRRDQVDPQALNPYTYAAQNPLRFLDPFGTSPTDAESGSQDALDAASTGSGVVSAAAGWTSSALNGFGNSGVQGFLDSLPFTSRRSPAGGLSGALRNSAVSQANQGRSFLQAGNGKGATDAFQNSKRLAEDGIKKSKLGSNANKLGNGATILSVGLALYDGSQRIQKVEDGFVSDFDRVTRSYENSMNRLLEALKRGAIGRLTYERRRKQIEDLYKKQVEGIEGGFHIDLAIQGTRTLIKSLEALVPSPVSIGDGLMALAGRAYGTPVPK